MKKNHTYKKINTNIYTLPRLSRPKHNDLIRTRKSSAVERVEGQAHHIYPPKPIPYKTTKDFTTHDIISLFRTNMLH